MRNAVMFGFALLLSLGCTTQSDSPPSSAAQSSASQSTAPPPDTRKSGVVEVTLHVPGMNQKYQIL